MAVYYMLSFVQTIGIVKKSKSTSVYLYDISNSIKLTILILLQQVVT